VVTMNAAQSVTATFTLKTYVITPTAGAGGSISPDTPQTVNYGGSKSFTVTPDPGYHIADVAVDGASVGAVSAYTFTNVTANHTIAAAFTLNTYTLTVSKDGTGSGTVSSTPPGISCGGDCTETYAHGTVVTLTATPLISSTFAGWSGAGSGTGDRVVTMNAAQSVTATFTLKTYVITPTAGAGGSISPSTPQTVNYGGSQTFTVTPNPGYHILDVAVDGASVGAVSAYTFTNVTANHTITATFIVHKIYLPLILKLY
jgi:hypothetical protein